SKANECPILIDVSHNIVRKNTKDDDRSSIVPRPSEAKKRLIGAIPANTIVCDTAPKTPGHLLDPAVLQRNIISPNEGIAVSGKTGFARVSKITVDLGAVCVSRSTRC